MEPGQKLSLSSLYANEVMIKNLDTSHLTRGYESSTKFPIQTFDSAHVKTKTVDLLTSRSFFTLIRERQEKLLSFVLAFTCDEEGCYRGFDAFELNRWIQTSAIDPVSHTKFTRISWYKIDTLDGAFTFLGDSITGKALFINRFILANGGDPLAQYELGCCYEAGDNVDKDLTRAKHFFRLAAATGHVKAFLKVLPEFIDEKRFDEIANFFEKLEVTDIPMVAVDYVRLFYDEKIALNKIRFDLLQAIACDTLRSEIAYLKGKCLQEGIVCEMSSDQAVFLFKEAAESCPKACYEIGLHEVKAKRFASAATYFLKAGKTHVPSQMALANVYRHPSVKELSKAFKILTRLCEKTIQEAFVPLALMHLEGEGTVPDYNRARELLEKASEFSFEACITLAKLLIEKEGRLHFDPNRAFKLAGKAIEMNPLDGRPYSVLFFCYFYGFGTKQSSSEALKALQEGMKLGDMQCTELIKQALHHVLSGFEKGVGSSIPLLELADPHAEKSSVSTGYISQEKITSPRYALEGKDVAADDHALKGAASDVQTREYEDLPPLIELPDDSDEEV